MLRGLISPVATARASFVHSRRLWAQVRLMHETLAQASTDHQTEWLVILPDRPNVLARRVRIRPAHSPNFARLHREGYVSWAGPLFDEHVDKIISQRPFKGSVMVVNESNWGGFMDKVQSDAYIQNGIWDLEKTQFIAFRTLMRSPAK